MLKSNRLLDGGGIGVGPDSNGCGSRVVGGGGSENVVVGLLIVVSAVGTDTADVAGGGVLLELVGGFLGFALPGLFLLDGDMLNRENAQVIDGT
jgi:hypothetical protein